MKVIEKAIKILQPYENNPRINDAAVSPVAESIKQFGFKVPIIIDSNNVIVCGHTRYKAAELLKLETVPCIIADDLTDEQIKAFRLADNKTAELAGWDFESLDIELAELSAIGFDMTAFEFDEIVKEADFTTDFELPDDDKPQTRTITLSLCEEQYIICTSCIEHFENLETFPHSFGNMHKKSNALFEAVYEWAEQKKLA